MTVAHTNALELLGKYVSFYINNSHGRSDYEGVVSSIFLQFDGSHTLTIGFDDQFLLSHIEDLKILGKVKLFKEPVNFVS